MCKAQFWNTAATNNGDDGKENDVVENGGYFEQARLGDHLSSGNNSEIILRAKSSALPRTF